MKQTGVTRIRKTVEVFNSTDVAYQRQKLETFYNTSHNESRVTDFTTYAQSIQPKETPERSNGVISTRYELPQPLRGSLGAVREVLIESAETHNTQSKEHFKPYYNRLNLIAEEGTTLPTNKQLKEGKKLLNVQDEKIMDIIQQSCKEADDIKAKLREFESAWNVTTEL